jgi:thiol-disulfide isomerase/thioredoxin
MPWRLAGLVAILIAAWSADAALAQDNGAPDFSRFSLYDPRPNAPAASFTDGAGERQVLADHRGRLVLLNFWATWCAPCVEEMPSLDRLQGLRGDVLDVVAVSVDRGGPATIERFFHRLGIGHLAVYQDRDGALSRAFDVRLYPSTYLIDRNGRIIAALPGVAAEWDAPESLALLDALAAEDLSGGAAPQDLKATETGFR